MTKLEALVEVAREVRGTLSAYLSGAELDAGVRAVMSAILDAALAKALSPTDGAPEAPPKVRTQ